ncbi:MAG: DEAD/DEAH box helicase [Nitriliruptorales bacterium]|nr:DEAD/DEAH box helicase [Nitriliruptorales bacterium]
MTRKTFTDLGISDQLVAELNDQDITEPFPIQELAIPMALKGADVIGQARTGTGKTLAFGLPLLERIDPDVAQTQAFVIVPTRELCLQVTGDLSIGESSGIRVTSVYGGVGYEEQNRELTTGVHVVVGTPGRLLDQLNRGNLDLSNVRELVLDEADEMLDMGFLPDVERLIEACAEDRHTMLFSATMPNEVVKLARRYMSHPTFLRADTEEHEVAPTVEQHFFLVHRMDKPRLLARLLQQPERGAAYVFTRTKRMADRLVNELEKLNTKAIAVHGDLRQASRERNMGKFRDGNVDVLVATEVAARGLDVDNATHVINYDCPDDHKMYLHRIGRTARAGASGVAITFAEFNEVDRLNVIRKRVEADREIQEVFSTSDEITERFDLPDETPWEHLGQTDDGGKQRRKGRSDGRSHNRSSSERRGQKRSRSRGDKQRDGKRDSKRGGKKDSSSRPAPRSKERRPPAERAEEIVATKDDRAERVRTRTRETPSGDDSRTRAKSSGKSSGGNGRTRARTSRKKETTGKKKDADRDRARSRDRGDRPRGNDSRDRGDKNRDRARNRKQHDNGDSAPPWEEPTAAGDEARGDGQPALARRVKVEHLP